MADKPNPLMPHGIIVIVVGAVLLAVGAWGAISNMAGQGATGGMRGVHSAQSQTRQVTSLKSTAGSLTRPPTSMGSAMASVSRFRQMKYTIMRIVGMGWMILLGGGMIAAGIFVLKQKNWARYLGFGGIAFAVLYFAGHQGAAAAHPDAGIALPLILVLVVAGLASKPLFDLCVEKFEAA